jgi:UDP-galactopyranose mutase
LSRFTKWRLYEHYVLASISGRLLPFPINIDTVDALFGTHHDACSLKAYFRSVAESVSRPRTAEEALLGKIGRELYEVFFSGYTRKQWGRSAAELDPSVVARVAARLDRDRRYFRDEYQLMPLDGYTRMFERMLAHPNITTVVGTEYRDIRGNVPYREVIFTGPIDEYFDFRFGHLPYRSIMFQHETHAREVFQAAPVINYPNDHEYTRITEFKYLTGQSHPMTSIVYEYPSTEGDPYYPVPCALSAELYQRYRALADASPNVHFVGRLGTYKYLNMDQVVGQALALVNQITVKECATLAEGTVNAGRKM